MTTLRPKQFDLLVFDWDGTLMDSTATIVACIQAACADIGAPVPNQERAAYVIGLGLQDALAAAVPGLAAEQIPRLVERYRHHYLNQDHLLQLFAGVRELLVQLQQAGYQLAIATGKSRVGLQRALHTTQLAPFFIETRCADETFSKPHPAMLLEIMEAVPAAPARTLMIGDTTHDVQMAHNADVAAIGLLQGAHGAEALQAVRPRACLPTIGHLHDWLLVNG